MSPNRRDRVPITVCLVDDDEVDRLTVKHLLDDVDTVRLVEFSSGEEALDYLRAERCDCLLLDYRMPGADGLEILDRLARDELGVPTIMLTGVGDEEVAVSSLQRGALDYLAKDKLDRTILLAKIRTTRMVHDARRRASAAERGLRDTIEQLQREAQARDSVLGVVSHDLRGPLNNIGLAMNLLESDDPSARATAMASVRRAIARADRLISDLLDVARLSGDQLNLGRRAVAAEEIVQTAVIDVRPTAEAKQIELVLTLAEDLGTVYADRDRVVQILDNLLRNAIKFGPAPGAIHVTARRLGDAVEFSVADEGPGVPPEQRPHVFDRFWQAKKKGSPGGSGLGLAIAKGLVEAHGGTIGVDASDAGGARFYLSIPIADDSESE